MNVLLVEDSLGDVRLMQEAFRSVDPSVHLHVAADGVEAMSFLRHEGIHADAPRPDIILLDLNLPKMDGREVLALVKANDLLRTIPVIVLTTSDAEDDITKSYELQANCFLNKPVHLEEFESLVRNLNEFWLSRVKLPPSAPSALTRQSRPSERATEPDHTPVNVLLVEDNPGDVRLLQEAFREINCSIRLHLVSDGVEAMAFLNREGAHVDSPRPDLVLLDLNLPRMDGHEVLARIKGDKRHKMIPTVILTTSDAEADVSISYQLHANCYLRKAEQWDTFDCIVRTINALWLTKARLPRQRVLQ